MYMKQTKGVILAMSFNPTSFKLSLLLTSGRREIAARFTSKNVHQCAFHTHVPAAFSVGLQGALLYTSAGLIWACSCVSVSWQDGRWLRDCAERWLLRMVVNSSPNPAAGVLPPRHQITRFWHLCLHTQSLQSCLTLCDPMNYTHKAPLSMGILQALARVGCHALLQGIFLTYRLNPSLLHLLLWQADSLPLALLGKLQFWHYPSGNSIWSHRLRAQFYKTAAFHPYHFRLL